MKKRIPYIVLFAILVIMLSACGSSLECDDAIGCVEIAPDEPIKIASLQAISGAVVSLGTDQVRAIEIAIDDKGPIHEHEVTLQSEDDLCSAEGGTSGAQRIVADDQILGIVGTSCSGAAVPASEIMSEAGLVMVSGSNTTPFLTTTDGSTPAADHHAGYYRTAHNDTIQGAAAAAFAFNELGVTRAASIHDGDAYTAGLTGVFNEEFEALGGEIVLATAVNKGDTDMRPVLTSVAASDAELVFFPIFQPEGDFIVLQSKEIEGFEDITLMAADGLLSDTYIESIGEEGSGMYFSGPATPSGSAYDQLVSSYQTEFGEAPIQAFHGQAYDAAMLILNAIEEVAQVGNDGTLLIGRQALRDAISSTSGYDGITGTLTCDEFGDCADAKIEVVQLEEPSGGITALKNNVVFTFEPAQ